MSTMTLTTTTPAHLGDRLADHDEWHDNELLLAIREGDHDALAALYRRYRLNVGRFAATLVAADQVEDLVADAFAKTYSALRSGHGPVDQPIRYLMTATRTTASSFHRRNFRDQALEQQIANELVVDATQHHEGFDAALLQAFACLSDRQRQVIWWSEVDELSPTEIGERLGIAPAAAASLAYRARGALRRAYSEAA